MTVCIAATYKNALSGEKGIVLANDWQITDTNTSFTSHGIKVAHVRQHIAIMGSGDMTYFGDLVDRSFQTLRSNEDPTVEDVKNAYWDAEADWRNEYREHHVLTKYGLAWKSYFEKLEGGTLPEAFFRQINEELKALPMPCTADVIIAGLNGLDTPNPSPRIIQIESGVADRRGREGFAIIGEGNSVALAEFAYAKYQRFWGKASVLFLCYLAKKRSEVIASVGDRTSLSVIDPVNGLHVVSKDLKSGLHKAWLNMNKTQRRNEDKAYEKARQLVQDEADKTGAGSSSAIAAGDGQ